MGNGFVQASVCVLPPLMMKNFAEPVPSSGVRKMQLVGAEPKYQTG